MTRAGVAPRRSGAIERALLTIRCELRCDAVTAFELLHERAVCDRTPLVETAHRVLDGRIRGSEWPRAASSAR